ncbi:S41 family peptidase [Lacticaseibacillus suibinensis]|uniref:S41 family peptidase n=1 Tax=Lacticaseibacillus suibinensis TaxID=2486011 RepID=UPI0013DD8B83|nr:S41 family peptidase [Lacticaseibacillus suibinensis]
MADKDQKPRRPFKLPSWLKGVLVAAAIVAAGGIGYALRPVLDTSVQQVPSSFTKVLATYNSIQEKYYKKTSSKTLANGAISGMMASLGDQFSTYLENDEKSSLDSTISASFGGIGATVQQTSSHLEVASLQAGSPSQKAGMKVGDQLVKVNGKSVEKAGVNAAVSKIRGKIGTTVTVTVRRDGKLLKLTMKRAKITTDTVTTSLATTDKTIGILTITSFSEPTAKQFKAGVKALRKQGAKKFIVDLRGNPGGLLEDALQIGSMGLKNGQTIVKVQDRSGATQVYTAGKQYDHGFKVKEPIAVLIDGDSASASEILAGAWNESRGVPLIGETSYGKGTVQNVAQISKNAEVKLTVAKWLTPNGNWINKKGLAPTIKTSYPAWAQIQGFTTSKMKLGDESADVHSLQISLQAAGQTIPEANGYFGPTTQTAVKNFQTQQGLPATGETDAATMQALIKLLSGKLAQNDNAISSAVTYLQEH